MPRDLSVKLTRRAATSRYSQLSKVEPRPVHLILEPRDAARHGIRLLSLGQSKGLDNPRANLLWLTRPSELLECRDYGPEITNEPRRS